MSGRVCEFEGCTESLDGLHPNKRFCQPHAAERKRQRERRTPEPRPCEVCGETFQPYKGDDKRCGNPECKYAGKSAINRKAAGYEANPARQRISHPTGYEPGYELNGDTGTVTSEPITTPPSRITSWDWLLERWHLDVEEYEVIEPVNIRTWLGAIGNQQTQEFYYYKASVRKRVTPKGSAANLAHLRDLVKATKPRRWKQGDLSDRTAILTIADLQLGKGDGDGTAGTVARFGSMLERASAICDRLATRGVEELVIPWLGDLVENVDGHYHQQGFTADLNMSEQTELATTLYVALNKTLAPMFPRVLNIAIPGNHGEVRKDGKSFTDMGDNWDTTAPWNGHQVIAERLPHVRFIRPEKPDLSLTVSIRGQIHGFTHGHVPGKVSGPTPLHRLTKWLEGQAAGMRAIGDAAFIHSGHYHHFATLQYGPRYFIQSPSLDGGSPWFADTKGQDSEPGTIIGLLNGRRGAAGYDWLTVIAGDPTPARFADRIAA